MSTTLPGPHPEWHDLLQQRDTLHSQLAAVITDLHSMADSRPVVLGRYAAAFGSQLIALQELEIEAARLKREIELVQAAINSGRDWDYQKIQETLAAEFAEWQAKLKAETDNLIRQQGVLDHLLDPATTRALRDQFRILARRLHPDLNPTQSPAEAELWHRVTAAYENQDLEELKALEILTRESGTAPLPDSMDSLRALVEKLRSKLDSLLTTIAARRQAWPFDQLPVLDDPAATAARQAELDTRITAARSLRDERKHWLNQILGH